MKLNLNCLACNLNQVLRITEILETDIDKKTDIVREVLCYLGTTDYERSNPEVMKGTWEIIVKWINNDDPYKDIKSYYNNQIDGISNTIKRIIDLSTDKFIVALKISIIGNIIDFAAKHSFSDKMILDRITNIHNEKLIIDDSEKLYKKLKNARTLLYIGDNCGEIVLDRLFIEIIKELFPNLHVYFVVRGKAIVNDVTIEDAKMVRMDKVAEIIDNGDGSLGTIIANSSENFKEKFFKADVIIAKGQGNYESLNEERRNNIFFLFMAKCDVVVKHLNIKESSIVCKGNFY